MKNKTRKIVFFINKEVLLYNSEKEQANRIAVNAKQREGKRKKEKGRDRERKKERETKKTL